MTSGKVDINGRPIWYEKFGSGSEIILLLPGAIGTGRTDFLPQLEGPYAFDQQKFTLVAMELPGWGRSRPPERKYDKRIYINDALTALKLMDILGYCNGYSVIGWSEGAKVALIMAMRDLTQVKCIVVTSIFVKTTRETVAPTLATQNTSNWPQEMREKYLPLYGHELQTLWDGYINFCKDNYATFPSGYWTDDLNSIRCPVLIIHGDMDPLVSLEHPLHVEKQIQGSILYRFKKGGHNCHQKYASDFKRIVENFLFQCNY